MAAKTPEEAIAERAVDGIQTVNVDGTSTTMMPIADQIKAAEFARETTAKSKNHLGLTFRELKPGGCG